MDKDTVIFHCLDTHQVGFTRCHHAIYVAESDIGNAFGVHLENHHRAVMDSELLKHVQAIVIQRPVGGDFTKLAKFYASIRPQFMFNLVYEFDDIIWEHNKEYGEALKEVANLPNFVVCSTRRLAKEWKKISNRPAIVLPNGVPAYTCGRLHEPIKEDFGDGHIPKVFYGGSKGHDSDFSKEWIDFLTEEVTDGRMELHCIVVPKCLEHLKDKIITYNIETPITFLTLVNTINPDFYIAPLEACTFNYCKSDLKIKEAAALGCVFIGSDIPDGPYNYIGKEMLVNGNIREVITNLYKADNYNAARLKLRQMFHEKGWNIHSAEYINRFLQAFANGKEV